jgi:hypothetical protein
LIREAGSRVRRNVRSLASLWIVVAVFVGSGMLACSRSKAPLGTKRAAASGAAGLASGRPEPGAVALCTALQQVPAERRAVCCAEASQTLYFDECVRHLSSAVRAGKVSLDGAKVAACAARVDATTRGCDWIAPGTPTAPAECAGAVTGKVAAGGRCTSSLECGGDLHCAGQGATTPGTCKPPQPLGAACGNSVDTLATYLSVRGIERQKPACAEHCALTSHRCEPEPPSGAACHASINCAANQRCVNGRCEGDDLAQAERRAEPGGPCATDRDCESGGCVVGANGARSCAMKCALDLASLTGEARLKSLALGRR